MPNIEVIPSTMRHAKELSLNLRENDKREAVNIGLDPVKSCFDLYRKALWKRTGLIDGKVAAMWGISGSLTSDVGQVHLITSNEIDKISPLKFMRVYKQQVEIMRSLFPVLENYVDASYHEAVRALKVAGFKVTKPITLGPKEALFCKFSIGE